MIDASKDADGWGINVLLGGIAVILVMLFGWFRDQINESMSGLYSKQLGHSYRQGMAWFIFSEIMFFAALIGTYIVIRFGAPTGTWPTPHDVHLVEPIGAFNTFVLICSSVTVVMALEAAKKNITGSAKMWLLATFLLGSVFLGVKAFEYKSKFDHGIYPAKPRSLIHEKADVYYAADVREK